MKQKLYITSGSFPNLPPPTGPRKWNILSVHLITTVFVLINTIIGLYFLLSLQVNITFSHLRNVYVCYVVLCCVMLRYVMLMLC